MLFKDLTLYDTETGSGTIKVHDLNYDGYQSGEAVLVNGHVNNYVPFPIPGQVAEKYNLAGRAAHPCDKNSDGNITFGECMNCMITACMSDPECRLLCMLANIYKWQCFNSMSISCRILAIIY